MKRLLLAVVLVAAFAFARTGACAEQDDAMDSLVGMADAAKTDKGPEAEEIPADKPGDEETKAPAPEPSKADAETAEAKPGEKPAPAPAPVPKREKAQPSRDDDGPTVAVPPAAAPRVWTKVFSSLLPAPLRPSSFEVAASTRAAHTAAVHPATAASAAGSAQGMLEVLSAATAPYGTEETMRDAVAEKPAPRR